jgi:hypothetical protein
MLDVGDIKESQFVSAQRGRRESSKGRYELELLVYGLTCSGFCQYRPSLWSPRGCCFRERAVWHLCRAKQRQRPLASRASLWNQSKLLRNVRREAGMPDWSKSAKRYERWLPSVRWELRAVANRRGSDEGTHKSSSVIIFLQNPNKCYAKVSGKLLLYHLFTDEKSSKQKPFYYIHCVHQHVVCDNANKAAFCIVARLDHCLIKHVNRSLSKVVHNCTCPIPTKYANPAKVCSTKI